LNATQALFPLVFVGKWLLPYALKEIVKKPALNRSSNIRDLLNAQRRGQLWLTLTCQSDERSREATIKCSRRKRSDAGHLY